MNAPLMRVWQNLVALGATICVAFGLLPLPLRVRIVCWGIAAACIVMLLILRARAHSTVRTRAMTHDTYARIERIRDDRARRVRTRGR